MYLTTHLTFDPMNKRRIYRRTKFPPSALAQVVSSFRAIAPGQPTRNETFEVAFGRERWGFDSLPEFMTKWAEDAAQATLILWMDGKVDGGPGHTYQFVMTYSRPDTEFWVDAPSLAEIESVYSVIEQFAETSKLPKPPPPPAPRPVVFIGHGRSPQWRDLKEHLEGLHNIKVQAYESGSRSGHTIRDVLADLLATSTFAVLVMTAEDDQADGGARARQNVVHEAGLFQGSLGFSRAIVVVEQGVEEFSNLQGVNVIRYSPGNIRETFGEVVAAVRREFG